MPPFTNMPGAAICGCVRPYAATHPPCAPQGSPPWLLFLVVAERLLDPLVSCVLQPSDNLRVDLVQDTHRMPSPLRALGRRHAGGQPGRHTRVAEVIRPPSERGGVLLLGQSDPAGLAPYPGNGRFGEVAPGQVAEQPTVRSCPELLQVLVEHLRELRRGRDQSDLLLRPLLQLPPIAALSRVGPGRSRGWGGPRQQQFSPASLRTLKARLAQHRGLLRPQCRVVHNREERLQPRARRSAWLVLDPLRGHPVQQPLRLALVDDHSLVDSPYGLRSSPFHLVQIVGR